jgi:hypothetical protein
LAWRFTASPMVKTRTCSRWRRTGDRDRRGRRSV